ncbi:MAG: hypothetical protein NZ853_05095 [Leptospiraceae bacterium]|nr:hypothetical protein [Leptospiraceae bacterium]MDW7976677.1 hypothetical protein [Leptospiraceae bacterium]
MENKEKAIRWRYYIDKKFQNDFMIRFAVLIVLVLLGTLIVLWLLRENPFILLTREGGLLFSMDIQNSIQCVQENGEIIQIPKPGKPYNAFQLYWKPILFTSVLNLLIIVIFSLFYSHSMAGPIFNIKRTLREMIETGTVKEIRIRKTDQFHDLVEVINEYIRYVNTKERK